jgi:hypothetical protein
MSGEETVAEVIRLLARIVRREWLARQAALAAKESSDGVFDG